MASCCPMASSCGRTGPGGSRSAVRRLDWRARPARRRIGADYRLPMTSRIHTHVRHALHPPASHEPSATHTHTRFHFRGRRGGGVVHVLIRRVDVYRRGRVILVRVVRILRALAARTTRPVSSSARRAHVKRDQRKPHTRAALVSLGACRLCAASHAAHGARACSGLQSASCALTRGASCTAQTRRRGHRPRPSCQSLPRPSPRRQMQSCRRSRPAGQSLPARAVIGGDPDRCKVYEELTRARCVRCCAVW